MQPYQEATEEIMRQGSLPKTLASRAGSTALGAAGTAYAGKALAQKALSLLNKYVPDDLAIKGLTKLDPRFGKFINTALSAGMGFNAIRNEISQKAEEGLGPSEPAKQDKNIIEQESPELHSFLDQEIRKGRKPVEAGALAQNDKRFANVIKKLMKAHKTPWSSIIESVFGTGEMAQPRQQQTQGQEQVGQGLDPGVAQILQQGNELLKRFRGQ